jgi:SAM-dependent methyltransferase
MIRLDLGAGEISPEGYTPMGHEHGSEIYPLAFADASIDVCRASHVLEHFPQSQAVEIVKEWARVLKPGGILRIAVPDFAKIAKGYLEGQNQPTAGWLMGGQLNPEDFHKSVFDRDQLRALLAAAGLVLLRPWQSEIEDCAAYDVSLNIEGTKPFVGEIKVSGAMSVPRLGFMANFGSAIDALLPLNIKLRRQGGAFWGQALENCMERILEEDAADAVLTLDYDSVFTIGQVAHLMQLMMVHPEIDALAPIQSNRHQSTALFTVKGEDGKPLARLGPDELEPDIQRAATAHFGLTLIRTEKLKTLPKPWFHSVPAPDGSWHDGHIDDDSNFWRKWDGAGYSLYVANRVAIGHIEEVIRWPSEDLQARYQAMTDFNKSGPPEWVWK